MSRRILLLLAIALFGGALVVAYLWPSPEGPLEFNANPCDGAIAAAFESKEEDGSDPYETESCRNPARRQLAVSGLLLVAGVGVVVVRRRSRTNGMADAV